ncbi:hypothetical protein KGQ24_01410 [Patescibacteria group bacterium]|nr:hypothetical protein [Patescibacteria group bacterium]
MLYLLLGSDDFSKKEFVEDLKSKNGAQAVIFDGAGDLAGLAMSGDLFGGKKIIIAREYFSGKSSAADGQDGQTAAADLIKQLKAAQNEVVFIEEKLDKRKTETKKLLASKDLKVVEFEIPQGAEFKAWVLARAKKLGLSFAAVALDVFLHRLTGQENIGVGGYGAGGAGYGAPVFGSQVLYDLWQADSELRKLQVFAGSAAISAEDVEALVPENIDDNIFKITNAIGDKNRALAVRYLTDYMDRYAGSDEKSKVISLSGLLAEQFRSILAFADLQEQGRSERDIAEATGFAPGKMFVYKKLAKAFGRDKASQTLRKLELLDEEIKTTQGPAALQFFMIIESALK